LPATDELPLDPAEDVAEDPRESEVLEDVPLDVFE
jgi:hypothetical protein